MAPNSKFAARFEVTAPVTVCSNKRAVSTWILFIAPLFPVNNSPCLPFCLRYWCPFSALTTFNLCPSFIPCPLSSSSFTQFSLFWTFVPSSSMYSWHHWMCWVLGMIQQFKFHTPLAYKNSPTFCELAFRKPSAEHFPLFLQFLDCRCQGVPVFSPFAGSCESTYWALYLRRWSFAETSQHSISPHHLHFMNIPFLTSFSLQPLPL